MGKNEEVAIFNIDGKLYATKICDASRAGPLREGSIRERHPWCRSGMAQNSMCVLEGFKRLADTPIKVYDIEVEDGMAATSCRRAVSLPQ